MRRLLQSPAYVAFSVITLSLGIGATTAGWSAVRSVLFSPPEGLTDPRLVNLYQKDPRQGGSLRSLSFGVSEYDALRVSATAFEDVVAHSPFRHSITLPSGAEVVWGELTSGNYFDALELEPEIGRLVQRSDDDSSAPAVVVISHALWQKAFGGAASTLGTIIRINDAPFEVVGVAPPAFRGTFNPEVLATAVWIPLAQAERLSAPGQRFSLTSTGTGDRWLLLKGRLQSTVTVREASTQVATIAARLDLQEPDIDTRRAARGPRARQWTVIPTANIRLHGQERFFAPFLGTAMAALVLVVLIACINVANLTAARMRGRSHEVLVRTALGATPARLLRQELGESAVLSAAGCGLGLVVAFLLMRLMAREVVIGTGAAISINPVFDPSVLLAAVIASSAAFVSFGLIPVMMVLRTCSRQTLMRDGDHSRAIDWGGRKRLVAIQVSVSVALLAGAAVCGVRIYDQLRRTTGIDLDRLAMLHVGMPSADVASAEIASLVTPLRHLVSSRANIQEFAVASGLPPLIAAQSAEIIDSAASTRYETRLVAASPELFRTIGLRTIFGRPFQPEDADRGEAVAVVSRRLAERLTPTGDPVGHEITYRPGRFMGEAPPPIESARIVGVVEEIGGEVEKDKEGAVLYVPLAQKPQRSLIFIARSGDPERTAESLFAAFRALRPDLSISMAGTAETFAGAQLVLPRLGGWLMSFLGITALILALVGLYSVLTLLVTARRRELGIRMALGASEREVVGLILRDGLSPVVVGLSLGLLVAAFGWSTASRMLLFTDPAQLRTLVLSVLAVLMLGVAYVACRIPAGRAARVDPSIALRHL